MINEHHSCCPKCDQATAIITDSRVLPNGTWRRRRRRCTACAHRWATLEVPERLVAGLPKALADVETAIQSMQRLQERLRAVSVEA